MSTVVLMNTNATAPDLNYAHKCVQHGANVDNYFDLASNLINPLLSHKAHEDEASNTQSPLIPHKVSNLVPEGFSLFHTLHKTERSSLGRKSST